MSLLRVALVATCACGCSALRPALRAEASRRDVLLRSACASSLAFGLASNSPPVARAAAAETLAQLREAREQLEPVSGLIAQSDWDGVRNVVKRAPLANVKALIMTYIDELGTDDADELLEPREEFVQALQLLDTFVYNNIFIGEHNAPGREGTGVRIDRETPLGYLSECKATLDRVIKYR